MTTEFLTSLNMTWKRRMRYLLLLGLSITIPLMSCHQSSDHLLMVTEGNRVVVPCDLPSKKDCSFIDWEIIENGLSTNLVKGGKVVHTKNNSYNLLTSCSLEITAFQWNDAKKYSCKDGKSSSNTSLWILNVTVAKSPEDDNMELHCSLNSHHGLVPCNNTDVHLKWTTEDNAPINGKRFTIQNVSGCFSKLLFTRKPTDHQRKWKCNAMQNGDVKASTSYTTIVKDGLEEVFGAAGDSVVVTCSNSSSLSFRDNVEESSRRNPQRKSSPDADHIDNVLMFKDSHLIINKLTPLLAGDKDCTEFVGLQGVPTKFRLHILDVTAESGPDGQNLTLNCVLTCALECEEDFHLTWSGTKEVQQRQVKKVNNTLTSQLFFSVWTKPPSEMTCSVLRDGEVRASKKWPSDDPLQTPTWVILPLGFLMCTLTAVLCVFSKRRRNKDPEQPSVEMAHVYDDIKDEEVSLRSRQIEREMITTENSFYNLLQPVN